MDSMVIRQGSVDGSCGQRRSGPRGSRAPWSAALGAALVFGWTATPTLAQDDGLIWEGREFTPNVAQDDEGREAVTWYDEANEKTWAFVAGKIAVSSTVTVIAVYKYEVVPDEEDPGVPIASRFYPDLLTASGLSRATGITVDPDTGDVYVVGETPVSGHGLDIVTLRLQAEDLSFHTGWAGGGGVEAGVRTFDGPADGNDYATDVVFEVIQGMLYVLGTSDGGAEYEDDIVVLNYEGDGGLSTTWDAESPDSLDGVRRWNNLANEGDDYSAEVTIAYWAETEAPVGPHVVATGTSYNGGSYDDDFVAISYNEDGSRTWTAHSTTGGAFLYHAPAYTDDVCTGLARGDDELGESSALFIGGYSVKPVISFMSSIDDIDFSVVLVSPRDGLPVWDPQAGDVGRHWAGPGSTGANDDYCWDLVWDDSPQLWLAGQARRGDGYDAAVVAFDAGDGSTLWSSLYELTEDGDDRAYSIALTEHGVFVAGEGTGEDARQHRLLYNIANHGSSPYYSIPCSVPYQSDEEDDGDGPALCVVGSDGTAHILVTGLHYFASPTQWDFGSACYLPDP